MSKVRKPAKPPIPLGAYTLALAQARALATTASMLSRTVGNSADAGKALAYLVIAGLSIELYFKAFMIAGRGGNVFEEHDLMKLLIEFPPYLRRSFNDQYDKHPSAKTEDIQIFALKFSEHTPDKPKEETFAQSYSTFDQAIESIARIFIDARYFFEKLGASDWATFSYPTHAISGVIEALEKTFKLYDSGAFTNEA